MATYAKTTLSGSTDGRGILVAATSSPGTTIHTGPTAVTSFHEIWLYAVNYDTTDRKLTVQWGSTTAGSDDIEFTVKAENGLYLIAPGLLLKGNATALIVRAFAATGTAIVLHGYVNTITA
jgi:hypothetical protein